MRFNQDLDPSTYSILSYEAGIVNIRLPIKQSSGEDNSVAIEKMRSSFIVAPRQLIEAWPPGNIDELTSDNLLMAESLQPEVLVVGTGDTLVFPNPGVAEVLLAKGIGVEFMDTGAACRTYNILMHEGREVAAAIIIQNDE